MKNFLIFVLLLTGATYLSSCSNSTNATTNALIIPAADSTTAYSDINIIYNNDTFNVHDLAVKGLPIEAISASITYNPTDSIWAATILLTDYTKTQISLNLTAYRDSVSPVGIYVVTTNSSTFTDFTQGENRTYSVVEGSTVTITNSAHPVIGNMSLSLHYNGIVVPATGTFNIYN